MAKFLDNFEQGTPEWLEVRSGHATGSRLIEVMGSKAVRENYLWDLVAERLSGEVKRASGSKSMQWGHDAEGLARQVYEDMTGNFVRQVGFALHDTIKYLGVSSDGLTEDTEGKGAIEIKSPFKPGVHARTWRHGMPEEHKPQVQGNIWVLGLDWLDYCSYDPSFPAPMNLYRQRIYLDRQYIADMEAKTRTFLAEVNIEVTAILKKVKAVSPELEPQS